MHWRMVNSPEVTLLKTMTSPQLALKVVTSLRWDKATGDQPPCTSKC